MGRLIGRHRHHHPHHHYLWPLTVTSSARKRSPLADDSWSVIRLAATRANFTVWWRTGALGWRRLCTDSLLRSYGVTMVSGGRRCRSAAKLATKVSMVVVVETGSPPLSPLSPLPLTPKSTTTGERAKSCSARKCNTRRRPASGELEKEGEGKELKSTDQQIEEGQLNVCSH
mgnify:CR=1 FL=1